MPLAWLDLAQNISGRRARPPPICSSLNWLLILAWLFRGQIAGFLNPAQIKPRRREFGNLAALSHRQGNVEDLRAEQAAGRLLIHGEETPAQPVPAFVIVAVVDTDFDFNLRLAPPAGRIWRRQSEAGIEVRQL